MLNIDLKIKAFRSIIKQKEGVNMENESIIKLISVICPECKELQKQEIIIESGEELPTDIHCVDCKKKFRILPNSRISLVLPPYGLSK